MAQRDDPGAVVEDTANRVLTFLHLCEEQQNHWLKVPLASMDGALALDLDGEPRSAEAGEIGFFRNTEAPVLWPIDVKLVQAHREGETDAEGGRMHEGNLQFSRVRSVAPPLARRAGAVRFGPQMALHETIVTMVDGTAHSAKGPLVRLGGRWQPAAPPPQAQYVKGILAEIAIGVALTTRYEWTVWLGHGTGPRLRFFSDPRGAREVFRLRDLPPGRERRTALRNWVEGHARRRRGDEDEEARSWVRRHLRGAEDFVWNGLRCRVEPPAYDVERLQREREAAGSGGTGTQAMGTGRPR